MKIRTIIIDDEELARDRLRQLLQSEPEIELVGEAADGREAVDLIQRHRPDLIFLDIQLPELDGFAVVTELADPKPVIVFCTAHDQFALKAFEVHAVDYLMKPFDKERFQSALGHASALVRGAKENVSQRQAAVLAELQPPPKFPERLAIKSGGRVVLVRVSEVDWIGSAHNYVEVHVGKETHLLRETLNVIETRLPPDKFVRISRTTIVNAERVKELLPRFTGEFTVVLQDGSRLTLSRRFRNKLPQLGVV